MQTGPLLKEILTTYLPKAPIILEAGAHIGRDTVKMATLWPDSTVHAFEPVADLYKELCMRTAHLPNVFRYPVALSDTTGHELLHVSSGASTAVSSFYEPYEYLKDRPDVFFTPETVPTITLDQWAQEQSVKRIDFMWLDMQGAEQKVLKAAPQLLETVQLIVLEVSVKERFKGAPLYDEIKDWIESEGFRVVQQDEPKHGKINLLCVRPSESLRAPTF